MILPVAAGVLRRPDGSVLIAQRPVGKIAAGSWEFPGGKIEAGETARDALARELHEELGITVETARPLICIRHAYAERTVELNTWLIDGWSGIPHGLEQQDLAWVRPENIWDYDLLAADAPIVHALRLPSALPVTANVSDWDAVQAGVSRLLAAGHKLFRLRLPQLNNQNYRDVVVRLGPRVQAAGAGMLIDRNPEDCHLGGVAGFHCTAAFAASLSSRPVATEQWLFASCHNQEEIERACGISADALVLGPVALTATHSEHLAIGWSRFEQLAKLANRPAYAIGGLANKDAAKAFVHGGQGVAAIRAYWSS